MDEILRLIAQFGWSQSTNCYSSSVCYTASITLYTPTTHTQDNSQRFRAHHRTDLFSSNTPAILVWTTQSTSTSVNDIFLTKFHDRFLPEKVRNCISYFLIFRRSTGFGTGWGTKIVESLGNRYCDEICCSTKFRPSFFSEFIYLSSYNRLHALDRIVHAFCNCRIWSQNCYF